MSCCRIGVQPVVNICIPRGDDFAELSRLYPVPQPTNTGLDARLSFYILNMYNLSSGCFAKKFIRDISLALMEYIINKNPGNFFPGHRLIEGFKQIQDTEDAKQKVLLLGQWLINHSHDWWPHMHAHRLLYVLHLAALSKSPIDIDTVRSWIPEKYQSNWELLIEDDIETGSPAEPEIIELVQSHYGHLFPKKKHKVSLDE